MDASAEPARSAARAAASVWIAAGALWAAAGVALGAFGAHALEEALAAGGQTANWETAVRYHVWHALALVAVGLWIAQGGRSRAAAPLFLAGSACFSGSLYALALGVPAKAIWFVTPLGGLLLILAWVALAVSALRRPRGGV